LNQIEIYFSILQRKALTPNDLPDLQPLAARITAFEDHHRQHRPGPADRRSARRPPPRSGDPDQQL
jgi:hypothetical protein